MNTKSSSFMNDAKMELGNKGLGGFFTYGAQWIFTKRKDESAIHEGDIQDNEVTVLQHLVSPFLDYKWMNEKLSVNAGIRLEWEKKEYPNQQQLSSSHLYFNPKLGINYTFSNNISSSFNWQTFIARPQYFVLSGITSQIYPFLSQSGNPFLKSTLVNKFNLDFSYKDLIIQMNAKHIRNALISFYQFDESTQMINQTFENRPTHWEYELTSIYQAKPFHFWTVNFYGELGYANFPFGNQPQRDYFNKISYFIDVENTFELPHEFAINVYSGYFKSLSGTEESLGAGGISGSIDKFFFNRKLYVSLNIGQYLQKRNRIRTEINNILINQLRDTSNRYIGLSVKYVFNTVKAKNNALKGGAGEIQRLK